MTAASCTARDAIWQILCKSYNTNTSQVCKFSVRVVLVPVPGTVGKLFCCLRPWRNPIAKGDRMSESISSVQEIGTDELPVIEPDPSFMKQMLEGGSPQISPCFQCLKCSSGCPLGFAMDHLPHQIIRMVQMGLKHEVLASSAIWLCASCETCVTRCPNGVELPRVMDALRQIAVREGVRPAEEEIAKFHDSFMDEIRCSGRVHEMSLIGRYKRRTRQWFQDAGLGARMFLRGRLGFLPEKVKDRDKVRSILRKGGAR